MCGLNMIPGRGAEHIAYMMNNILSHRGLPSRSHVMSSPSGDFQFGHVRLPIQGLDEHYDQPYHWGENIFLFVGEIFNYKELVPHAQSDIECLAIMWDKYGIKCFNYFDGFWSVIVYQSNGNVCHVITDFLAKKPLYLHLPTGAVSSEIKAFLPLTGNEPSALDPMYFSAVEKWGYHTGQQTYLKDVIKLPPGSRYVIDHSGRVTHYEHWTALRPRYDVDIRLAIQQAVQRRVVVSDVPVSMLVSGGLDSTIILELTKRYTADSITLFHFGDEELEYLDKLNIPSGYKVVKLDVNHQDADFPKYVERVMYYNDGPVDLGSMLPQYDLAQAINAAGFQVAISGDGADELFGGYRRMKDYDSQYSDIFEELVYYHLPRLDKLMMSHTVELRCPFLSRPVIEGAMGLAYEQRKNKTYLRYLFEDIVPREIVEREKYPLKSKQVKKGGIAWSRELSKQFKRKFINWNVTRNAIGETA